MAALLLNSVHSIDKDCPFKSCPQEERHPWACEDRNGGLSKLLGKRWGLEGYFAAVTAMDLDIGRILDSLEEKGLRDNTLIFFTSDNGFACGHHGFWGKGNGTIPVNMYEQTIKVPFVASHPGGIPQGLVQSGLFSAYDFMPTLLDYLGLPVPGDRELPGQSFAAALKGDEDAGRESVIIYDEYGTTRLIRTEEWKYVHRYPDGPHELYDLVNDAGEYDNLVDNSTQADRVKDLRGQMESWFAQYSVPDKDGRDYVINGNGQLRPVGRKWEDGREPFAHVRWD